MNHPSYQPPFLLTGDARRNDLSFGLIRVKRNFGEILGPANAWRFDQHPGLVALPLAQVPVQGDFARCAQARGAVLDHRAGQLRHPRCRGAFARAEGEDMQEGQAAVVHQFQGLVAPEHVAVVPNGIADCGVGCVGMPRLRKRWQVLYLNTLNKMKGALVLLEAISLVIQKRTDVEFIFAGPWSHDKHRKEAEAYIAQQGIGSSITFAGQVSGEKKTALLHAADLFVFPGIQQEGQPLVVLEAMAAGLPIIFTNRGCLREALCDGESGIIVPTGDATALADRIQWLLSRPDEMKRLGANARLRFEGEYTSERHLDRMTAVFEGAAVVAGGNQAPILLKSLERDVQR